MILRLVYRAPVPGEPRRPAQAASAARHAPATSRRVVDRRRPDRRHGRRLPRLGRHHDRRPGHRRLRRSRRALRPAARRGGAAGDPQRDVGPAPRLVLVRAGAADSRPARRRRPGIADRHALRRPPLERQGAHVLRQSGGAGPPGATGRGESGGRGRSPADPRARRVQRKGRARDVPLPHVLRARGDAAGISPRRHRGVPRHPSERGDRDRQPGLPDPGGLRGRSQESRASRTSPTTAPPAATGRPCAR